MLRLSRTLMLWGCVALLAACDTQKDAGLPGPTPREILFDASLPAHPRISPDGTWVSFVQNWQGAPNLWLKPVNEKAAPRPITKFPYPGIGPHVWHPSGNAILLLRRTPNSDDVRPYAYDLARQEVRSLGGALGQQASFLSWSREQPGTVYIQTNASTADSLDIYQVDIESGASLLVFKGDLKTNGYFAGPDLDPLFAQVPKDDGGYEWRQRVDGKAWRLWGTVPAEDALTTRFEAISADGQTAYIASSIGRDTTALFKQPVVERFSQNTAELIAGQEAYDFLDASYDVQSGMPFVATFATPQPSFVPLDNTLAGALFGMRASGVGQLYIADAALDAQRWLVAHVDTTQPAKWSVYDAEDAKRVRLFADMDDFMAQQSAIETQVVELDVAGKTIDGFLTRPLGLSVDENGAVEKPLPAAIVLRGALASQDGFRYRPLHQWLASRGVAVLSFNHSGSTGQGKSHLFQGDDLLPTLQAEIGAAASWLRARNMGETGLAFVASGFGSLPALQSVSDAKAACVALANPLVASGEALASLPAKQGGLERLLKGYLGPETTPPETIGVPVFIAHGAKNRRQPLQTIIDWAAQADDPLTPVTLLVADDAAEQFNKAGDARAVMASMELFLADCLGFDAESVTAEDVSGANITLLNAPPITQDALVQALKSKTN